MNPTPSSRGRELVNIQLQTRGGPELGAGLSEYQSVTIFDEAAGHGKYRIVKFSEEQPYPIGAFVSPLPPATFTQLGAQLRSIAWQTIPAASAGGPGTTAMQLTTTLGTDRHELRFTSRDIEVLQPIEALLETITATENQLLNTPLGALQAVASFSKSTSGVVFQLELTNIGSRAVWLAHPLTLTGEHDAQWAGIKVAPVDSNSPLGHTLQWQFVPLERPPEAVAPELRLQPGERFVAQTKPWPARAQQPYVYAGIYANYHGDDAHEGDMRIRGMVYSPRTVESFAP